MRRTFTRLALLTALVVSSLPVRGWAQFGAFGQNKIQ